MNFDFSEAYISIVLALDKTALWILFSICLYMLSQNAICFLGFGAGQQAVAMLSKSEFTAMWMEVDSGHSVTSTKGKAIKHPGLKAISQA